MKAAFLIALLAGPFSAVAQDETGADTAGNWVVTYQQAHGIWSTICDERANAPDATKRCYIRWVDVFSPRPKFGAAFVFVTSEPEGIQVEFGLEPGTLFAPDGFRIDDWVGTTWSTTRLDCLTGLACRFSGEAALPLMGAMQDQGAFVLEFVDRHGQSQSRNWPLRGFAAALDDFHAQRQTRGLAAP